MLHKKMTGMQPVGPDQPVLLPPQEKVSFWVRAGRLALASRAWCSALTGLAFSGRAPGVCHQVTAEAHGNLVGKGQACPASCAALLPA